VRSAAAVFFWLVATAALAVAVPAGWAQRNIVNADGYAALAQSAAHDSALQKAMASELATQVGTLARRRGYNVANSTAQGVANTYTASSAFPGQFGAVNRVAHQWLFTDAAQSTSDGWQIDLAPMLADTSFNDTLSRLGVDVPQTVTVPVTSDAADTLRPGQLRLVARWGPWVSIGAAAVTAVAALLMVAVARRRGKALAALGVSALLVGGGGWAALAICRGRVDDALNRTTGNVRTIADVMVNHAEASLHQWLNLTLAAGGALVVFGVIVAMLGGLRHRPRSSATGTRTTAPI
jgi:hypothetical protein